MRIIADIVGLETELSCLELIGRSMKVLVGGSSGQIRDI